MSDDDRQAIRALIARQFACMNWTPEEPADWNTFAGDFLAGTTLVAAARPARRQTVEAFLDRMRDLAETDLRTFAQAMLGSEILVFGNVAVALGPSENTENETTTSRGVEAFLLVKDGGAWRIAAQAWDMERDCLAIPDSLFDGGTGN